MILSAENLAAIAGTTVNDNARSVLAGLQRGGVGAGLDRPQRLAIYLAQVGHESGGWVYDREVWANTAAQSRYDTRTDLGNTAARDGDGYRYRGRTAMQLTGRANYARFSAWARAMDSSAPDFVANPDAVNTDPWEGLVPIWYWDTRHLNRWADAGDFESVTRRINGGLNGLADRQRLYVRAALVLLGYEPGAVARFQRDAGLTADGRAGPVTRDALHRALTRMAPLSFSPPPTVAATRPAPKPEPSIDRPDTMMSWLRALLGM